MSLARFVQLLLAVGLLAVLLFATPSAMAEGRRAPVLVPDPSMRQPIGRFLEVLVEKGAPLTLEQAVASPDYVPSLRDQPSWGLGHQVIWARFRTPEEAREGRWLLHFGFPRPQRVELFERNDEGVFEKRAEAGTRAWHEAKAFGHDHVVPIDASRTEHLLRIEIQPARLNIALVEEQRHEHERGTAMLWAGLYLGIFLGLFLYNLFLGASLRDSTHVFYCIFLIGITGQVDARDAVLFIDWPDALYARGGAIALTSIAMLLFARRLLRWDELSGTRGFPRRMERWTWVLVALCTALTVAGFLGAPMAEAAAAITLVSIVSVLVAGIHMAMKGSRPARWFLVAWGVLIASCIRVVLHAFGLADGGFLTEHGIKIGSALEMVLLSQAMAVRIKTIRDEREAAEKRVAWAEGELARGVIRAQEEERGRFARELHDGLGHALLLLRQRLLMAGRKGRALPPDEALSIAEDVRACIDDARSMARNLVPTNLAQVGLIEALRSSCLELSRGEVEVRFDGSGARALDRAIFDDRAIHVWRLVQEALTNAIRHARASRIDVHVALCEDDDDGPLELEVTVADDGVGFDPDRIQTRHLGLTAMRQRAELLGGALEIRSNEGTRVTLRVPLSSLLAARGFDSDDDLGAETIAK